MLEPIVDACREGGDPETRRLLASHASLLAAVRPEILDLPEGTVRGRIARARVVIAAHESNRERRMLVAPAGALTADATAPWK